MTEEHRQQPPVVPDGPSDREADLRPAREAILGWVRAFAPRYVNDGRRIVVAAVIGGLAGGGFVWLWRGDWGGGVNPLGWNELARAEFFAFIKYGAAVGGLIGLFAGFRRRRQA